MISTNMITANIITAINALQPEDEHSHSDEHAHEEHLYAEQAHEGHAHGGEGSESFLSELGHLLTDPAHLAFEFIFSIVFDLVIVTLLYGIVIRKVIIPRLKKSLHEEIDREHGVEHKEPEPRK